jgi:hypothetical protein
MPNKTIPTTASVPAYIASLSEASQQRDCKTLVELFMRTTGQKPVMWGDRIIGFGIHRYPLASGRTGEICKAGFAPRSKSIAFYLADFPGRAALLEKLGRYKMQGGCLHVATLTEVDQALLAELVRQAYLHNLQTDQIL